jgi:hypothetical protein
MLEKAFILRDHLVQLHFVMKNNERRIIYLMLIISLAKGAKVTLFQSNFVPPFFEKLDSRSREKSLF